jgi:hypothetical protein
LPIDIRVAQAAIPVSVMVQWCMYWGNLCRKTKKKGLVPGKIVDAFFQPGNLLWHMIIEQRGQQEQKIDCSISILVYS